MNVIDAPEFQLTRDVLAAKRKALVKSGYGHKSNATRPLTDAEEDLLWAQGFFGDDNPNSLLNGVWWLLSLHYGFRARHEQKQLKWVDIQYMVTGAEVVVWAIERAKKKKQGTVSENPQPNVYSTGTERCLVKLFKSYRDHRPKTCLKATDPFFLQVDHQNWQLGQTWFKGIGVGKNRLRNILTEAKKKFGMKWKKVSNHTVRKTGLSRLFEGGVPETFIAQHEGMKSADSLKSYKAPGEKHMLQISHALDRFSPATSTSSPPPPLQIASTEPISSPLRLPVISEHHTRATSSNSNINSTLPACKTSRYYAKGHNISIDNCENVSLPANTAMVGSPPSSRRSLKRLRQVIDSSPESSQ